MQKLHAKYFKIVAAGGDLDAASQIALAKDAISIKGSGMIVEHMTSDNPNPVDRHEVGSMFEVRAVLAGADQDTFVQVFGGTHTSSVYTKTQGIRTLSDYDLRVAVYRSTDGLLILKDFTYMNFEANLEEGYELGKRFYLPILAKSTSQSTYTSDNSAS